MTENNQLSDEAKNNSTDTSSTDVSSAVIGNHENAVVPHKISNHDKLVQTMVMVDGEWINVNDTNDQANMKEDMHKVNKKVVEAQKGIVEAKNSAESAVKYADSAVSASKVNSNAIVAQSSAISEAKAAADDAASKAQFIKENASSEAAAIRNQVADVANNVSSVKVDVASAASDVANLKVDVQANSAAIIKTNEAVSVQSKSSSDAINELKIANGQVESIAKDAKNNATVAKQTADTATTLARDAKSNAVLATQTATSATVEATNATSTATKAELSVNGLTTRVTAIEGDNKKLSNQITSTETILQQTKDQLLQKADKSVINQAQNLINQLSAEQKVMAGQIEQKVSSAEYQTLKDKVNRMKVGTRNLLHDTSDQYRTLTGDGWMGVHTSSDEYTSVASYHNGNLFTYAATISNTSDVPVELQVWRCDQNKNRLTNGMLGISAYVYPGQKDIRVFLTGSIDNNTWYLQSAVYSSGGQSGQHTIQVKDERLVEGNVEGTWEANPTDTIASIQKNTTAIDENSKAIKLKADATEVNNLKNTVTSHSASINLFSDQLKSMVTESKVNDIINGKGFTTQSTVQSLIDQKAGTLNESITKLDSKIDESGGGINLQGGTAGCSLPIGSNGPRITIENYDDHTKMIHAVGSKSGFYIGYDKGRFIPEVGETYTFSADIKGKGTINGNLFKYEGADRSSMGSITLNNNWQRIKTTVHVSQLSGTWIIYPNPDNGNNDFYVKNIKIERGSIATPYSQAPSDNASVSQLQSVTASIDGLQSAVKNKVDQSQYTQLAGVVQTKVSQSDFNRLNNQVNVQTLDSANIDNMKTTGHYFVRNLTGNPIGGWVYVDVTGNANDRIRQDVYQDSGTKHAFRRWFGTYWTGWSTGAEESEITQLRSDINLRVKSGDLLSQINIAAGHTLIQSNKIYFDADSFVMSPNSKAFIPSAYITNINADKITTGTLDAAKFNVKNFSADNIVGGTLNGVVVKTGTNDRYFQTSKDNIYWVRNDGMSLVGNDTYLNRANGLNIADMNNIQLTTWGGASVNPDGSIVNTSGNAGHPKIVVDTNGNWDPDDPYGTKWGGGPGDSEIAQWVGNKEYTALTRGKGFTVHLNDGNNNSKFSIQKDNKVGFYVGQGENGNQVNVQFSGDGSGFNVHGNFNVYGAKNSAVKTSQGDVAVSAYETAEYYFGDIGEGQTGDSGIAFVGIEKLFSETVNTSIPYQVFITAYGPGNLWVDQREHDRFVVKSDRPNVKFGWEIKAKRRGYENTRLQKVN
ncbi:hypothetical protein CBF94_11175 [Limosilactobacillus reuteri]|uniref:hypothetical protein n=1 Tax=Limosilactobacillus reuteri TaxID=1598 RepID=UPI000B98CB5A|nr:hypothetical protein [Limosilactobacillus reuteri]OYS66849.1 hypothetical protein CBF94_11175 [Limosilactobacillus reuteri]